MERERSWKKRSSFCIFCLKTEKIDVTRGDIIRKNMDLLNEFMKYAFDHPEILDQVPTGGEVVILPLDEPAVMRENRKIAERQRKAGKEVVLIKFRRPKPVTPALELMGG